MPENTQAAPDGSASADSPALAPELHYSHPQASHITRLGAVQVAWQLRRSARRSIGLRVGDAGLSISAPRHTPLAEIEAVLHAKARWVIAKLAQSRQQQQRRQARRPAWGEGAALPWLGTALTLRREPRPASATAPARWQPEEAALYLNLPPAASAAQWRDAARAWVQRQARRHFTARLDHYAPLMGVRWQSLTLSSARTRWGSANTRGRICLNWQLMHMRAEVIDYVVVHELAHLHEMNHSPRFWAHVQAQLPHYPHLRAELREQTPDWWG